MFYLVILVTPQILTWPPGGVVSLAMCQLSQGAVLEKAFLMFSSRHGVFILTLFTCGSYLFELIS